MMPTATEMLKKERQAILKMVEASEAVAARLRRRERVLPETLSTFQEFFRNHGKEEEIFSPLLETRGVPRTGGPLGVMLGEHEHGRSLVRHMGEASEAYASEVKGSAENWSQAS